MISGVFERSVQHVLAPAATDGKTTIVIRLLLLTTSFCNFVRDEFIIAKFDLNDAVSNQLNSLLVIYYEVLTLFAYL